VFSDMRTKMLLVLIAFAVSLRAVAEAQLLVLNGALTKIEGTYEGVFEVGDTVSLSMDFYHSAEFGDAFHGTRPGLAQYVVNTLLTVGGKTLPAGPTGSYVNSSVAFLNDHPALEGIMTGQTWRSGGVIGGIIEQTALGQKLLSPNDILYSTYYFPADIPFSEFSSVSGYYETFTSNSAPGEYDGIHVSQRIEWDITSYSGYGYVEPPPLIRPVPEPATFGIFGALGLAALAAFRRKNLRASPAPFC